MTLINSGAVAAGRCEEAVLLVSAGVALVIPLTGTPACGPIEPQGIGGRVLALSANRASGQPDILIPCFLVEVAFDGGLKASGTLEYHLPQITDVFKIKTVGANPVHTDVAYHQHS